MNLEETLNTLRSSFYGDYKGEKKEWGCSPEEVGITLSDLTAAVGEDHLVVEAILNWPDGATEAALQEVAGDENTPDDLREQARKQLAASAN
jgi:hypothetical protein